MLFVCRLFEQYMYMNKSMVNPNCRLKVFYHTGTTESLIGWVSPVVSRRIQVYTCSYIHMYIHIHTYEKRELIALSRAIN